MFILSVGKKSLLQIKRYYAIKTWSNAIKTHQQFNLENLQADGKEINEKRLIIS